jgi:hypothetical protein
MTTATLELPAGDIENTSGDAAPIADTAPAWTVAGIEGQSPRYGKPAPIVAICHLFGDELALQQWGERLQGGIQRLRQAFAETREKHPALEHLRRAETAKKRAEQELTQAREAVRAVAQAALDPSRDRKQIEADRAAAESAQERATERLGIAEEMLRAAKADAGNALEASLESTRKRLQNETVKQLAEADAALAAAVGPHLVDAIVLRQVVLALHRPATRAFSGINPLADFNEP